MIFGGNPGPPQPIGSGTTIQTTIRQLVEDGTVPMERLDDAVRRILAVKCEMGLFDSDGVIDAAATARVGSADAPRCWRGSAVAEVARRAEERQQRAPAVEDGEGRAGGRERPEQRQPVRRLDDHLAGDERRQRSGRDQHPLCDGGGDRGRQRGLFGERQHHDWRGRRRRRDRREAVRGGEWATGPT